MALSALDSLVLTVGICCSVHLLVTLLESIEEHHKCDCSELMKNYARNKFFSSNIAYSGNFQLPYYH